MANETRSKWPETWEHKETKKQVRSMPWWECLDPILTEKDDVIPAKMLDGRKCKIGSLIQIGWLLENEHGVWMGVGPSAKEHFNVIVPEL